MPNIPVPRPNGFDWTLVSRRGDRKVIRFWMSFLSCLVIASPLSSLVWAFSALASIMLVCSSTLMRIPFLSVSILYLLKKSEGQSGMTDPLLQLPVNHCARQRSSLRMLADQQELRGSWKLLLTYHDYSRF